MPNSFVTGDDQGVVRYLRPNHRYQVEKGDLIFKGNKAITHLTFSPSGKYLGISSDSSAVLYSLKSKKIIKLPNQHEGYVIKSSFCNDRYIYSIGNEGKLFLYQIKSNNSNKQTENQQQSQEQDPFQEYFQEIQISVIDQYKIAHESVSRKYPFLNACYTQLPNNNQTHNLILASGQIFMQVIQLTQQQITTTTDYKLDKNIKQDSQILQIQVLNTSKNNNKVITMVTTTNTHLSLWNFNRYEKILSINLRQEFDNNALITVLCPVFIKQYTSFAFLSNNLQNDGKVYYFTNHQLLDIQHVEQGMIEEQHHVIQEKKMEEEEQSSRQYRRQSIASKILPHFPQFPLQKGYEEYSQTKFLFYNNIGCIIQRKSQQTSTLQLQLHDRSKPKRYRIDNHKSSGMFALKQTCFLCATINLIVFQTQKMINQNFQGWQVSWFQIQGVAIGNTWVAACNKQQIRILDYSGNDLHSISFDRKFVTMQAYEDLLAVVYHSSLPIWGCQVLKMKIYKINDQGVTIQRDVPVVLKPNSILKWFGFSQQGMIYCQDSLQYVRSYSFDRNQWQVVFDLDGKQQCLFIQHIQASNIYGFRLQHRENQKEQPKVLPRTLPRKIPMQFNYPSLDFLSVDQLTHLRKLILKNYLVQHQQYRRQNWYKYKYSRKSDHAWFQQSKTISSQEEIKTMKAQLDLQLHDYLKKYLARKAFKRHQYNKIAMSLLLICQRQAHFEQTKDKLKTLLTKEQDFLPPSYLSDIQVHPAPYRPPVKQKLNEISILQQMINLMQ